MRLCAVVITVSDTRTLADDSGGALLVELIESAGHRVVDRSIVPDEVDAIRAAVDVAVMRDDVHAVLLTGGTGIAARDVTPEALEPILDRVIPGFGELFRALSYQEIGSAALLSRALAGTVRGRVVVALPGSRAAIRLAVEKLLLPELPHLASEAAKGA
ncbi:MAG: MogA/MoaB family molybdenum cofactor biosynthesis protein [Proteobacteria bacterium]|jgi:molybdenum cofactor biosynthesis protein B|nr:MogA/MoaB family molybdenum cofactor biosynthesis protein [Pseudomonadota bacterium]